MVAIPVPYVFVSKNKLLIDDTLGEELWYADDLKNRPETWLFSNNKSNPHFINFEYSLGQDENSARMTLELLDPEENFLNYITKYSLNRKLGTYFGLQDDWWFGKDKLDLGPPFYGPSRGMPPVSTTKSKVIPGEGVKDTIEDINQEDQDKVATGPTQTVFAVPRGILVTRDDTISAKIRAHFKSILLEYAEKFIEYTKKVEDFILQPADQYYIAFGVGPDMRAWRGPYIATLSFAEYSYTSEGLRTIKLIFTPNMGEFILRGREKIEWLGYPINWVGYSDPLFSADMLPDFTRKTGDKYINQGPLGPEFDSFHAMDKEAAVDLRFGSLKGNSVIPIPEAIRNFLLDSKKYPLTAAEINNIAMSYQTEIYEWEKTVNVENERIAFDKYFQDPGHNPQTPWPAPPTTKNPLGTITIDLHEGGLGSITLNVATLHTIFTTALKRFIMGGVDSDVVVAIPDLDKIYGPRIEEIVEAFKKNSVGIHNLSDEEVNERAKFFALFQILVNMGMQVEQFNSNAFARGLRSNTYNSKNASDVFGNNISKGEAEINNFLSFDYFASITTSDTPGKGAVEVIRDLLTNLNTKSEIPFVWEIFYEHNPKILKVWLDHGIISDDSKPALVVAEESLRKTMLYPVQVAGGVATEIETEPRSEVVTTKNFWGSNMFVLNSHISPDDSVIFGDRYKLDILKIMYYAELFPVLGFGAANKIPEEIFNKETGWHTITEGEETGGLENVAELFKKLSVRKAIIPVFKSGYPNPNILDINWVDSQVFVNALKVGLKEGMHRAVTQVPFEEITAGWGERISEIEEVIKKGGYPGEGNPWYDAEALESVVEDVDPDGGIPTSIDVETIVTSLLKGIVDGEGRNKACVISSVDSKNPLAVHWEIVKALMSFSTQLTLETTPMFNFSETWHLMRPCLVFIREPKAVGVQLDIDFKKAALRNFMSGVYSMVGFKHTISGTKATSSFNLVRVPMEEDYGKDLHLKKTEPGVVGEDFDPVLGRMRRGQGSGRR